MPAAETSAPRTIRLSGRASAQIQRLPLPSPASGEEMAGAVFHDTEDRALRRRGITLSRSADPERGWLLSIPEGDDHWAVEVPRLRSAPQRMPAAVAPLLTGIVGQDELIEVDDDADGQPPVPDAGKKTTKKSAKSATKAAGKKSKAATGGELTGVDVLQAVLTQQSRALELWDLKARLDLPDALHQLRVTARSLRGLLKSARPFLDRETADELGDRLQQLGRSLSAARDAEVLAELLPARAEALQGRVSQKTVQALEQTALKHAEASAAKVRGGAQPERAATLELARCAAQNPPFTDKGRKKAEGLRVMVVPGSARVRLQAMDEGLDRVFEDFGAEWRFAGCSMCLGMNPDQLAPGERCASTSNRNFEGRQGKGGRTHLVSPVVAAATAVLGRLASPSDLPALTPQEA